MNNPAPLREFFAVAGLTLWKIHITGFDGAAAAVLGEVIAIYRDEKVDHAPRHPVGRILHSTFVGIASHGLVFYNDERRRLGASEDEEPMLPEEITGKPVGETDSVIGLFLSEDEGAAHACLRAERRVAVDPRWLNYTQKVIAAVTSHKRFILAKENDITPLMQSQVTCSLM